MRERGNGSNLISSEGLSRPLSYGEKCCLEQQRKNRADEGKTPGQVEEANLRSISTDTAMKTPRRSKY
jgi:hypothetical protein